MTQKYLKILSEEIDKLSREERDRILSKLRDDIDKIDEEIAVLLIRRLNISLEIGDIKRSMRLDPYDARREREISDNMLKISGDPSISRVLTRIYERIIDESRAIQKEREK